MISPEGYRFPFFEGFPIGRREAADRGIGLLSKSFSRISPEVAPNGLHLGCLPWGGPGETRGGAFLVGRVFPWRP
jgi:hypothetical protein